LSRIVAAEAGCTGVEIDEDSGTMASVQCTRANGEGACIVTASSKEDIDVEEVELISSGFAYVRGDYWIAYSSEVQGKDDPPVPKNPDDPMDDFRFDGKSP
jgi:hypothetical protein